jgi:hypothetical protein
MEAQLAEMQRSTEVSQRAWVSISQSSITVSGPLSFDSQGNGTIRFSCDIRNTGQSPALEMKLHARLIALRMQGSVWDEVISEQSLAFDDFRKKPSGIMAQTVFPGDVICQRDYPASVYQQGIADALESRKTGLIPNPGKVSFILIICVEYQFSFSTVHHQSRYAFYLGIPLSVGWTADFVPEGIILGMSLFLFSQSAD